MKYFMTWAVLFCLIVHPCSGNEVKNKACYPEAVYLVRHAEKVKSTTNRDPGLTLEGMQRSRALAKRLSGFHIDHIYSTQYQRTRLTVTPTAKMQQLEIEIYSAQKPQDLIKKIKSACKQNILVAGHSNTIPDLLIKLGVAIKVTVGNTQFKYPATVYLNEVQDYGSLFKVNFDRGGNALLKISSFGDHL